MTTMALFLIQNIPTVNDEGKRFLLHTLNATTMDVYLRCINSLSSGNLIALDRALDL